MEDLSRFFRKAAAPVARRMNEPVVVEIGAQLLRALLSRAYIPFVAQLLRVLGEQMSKAKLDQLMRTVGHRLAEEAPRLRGDLRKRVDAASLLLNELGALTDVEKRGKGFVIRGQDACWRKLFAGGRRCAGRLKACWPS